MFPFRAAFPSPKPAGASGTRRRSGVMATAWGMRRLWVGLAWVLACSTSPPEAPYPHESVLTVIAELKLHLQQDPYLYAPGRDMEGCNIFRVTLERVDHLKDLVGPDYADVLDFAQAQCLERQGRWTDAAGAFEAAARAGTSLRPEALERARAAERMAQLLARPDRAPTLEGYLNKLDIRQHRLEQWLQEDPGYPYGSFARAGLEQVQRERARLLVDHRNVLRDGVGRARQAIDRLIERHEASWRICHHFLLKGRFYETLALDWVAQNPPEGATFLAGETFDQLMDRARGAYRHVARADGNPAKPEGRARLRALEAFALRMRERAR